MQTFYLCISIETKKEYRLTDKNATTPLVEYLSKREKSLLVFWEFLQFMRQVSFIGSTDLIFVADFPFTKKYK